MDLVRDIIVSRLGAVTYGIAVVIADNVLVIMLRKKKEIFSIVRLRK